MPILDDEFVARLANAPDPEVVVRELFDTARSVCEERVFLSVIDLETMMREGKRSLTCPITRHLMTQQFAKYFSQVLDSLPNPQETSNPMVARRLQMLAYSQFWECTGIQRILSQLTRIVAGESYEARLFLDKPQSTFHILELVKQRAGSTGLTLHEFLDAVYSNVIRNAFAHSEVWEIGEFINFGDPLNTQPSSGGSLKCETWDMLFKTTCDFIIALFRARRELEAELRAKTPYRVTLPEFAKPLRLSRDDRGYWSAQPIG